MNKKDAKFTLAILAYPGMTMLDAIGPNEVLANSPMFNVIWVTTENGPIQNDLSSFAMSDMQHFSAVTKADILLIPGGPGDKAVMNNTAVLNWIRQIDQSTTLTTSVCSGSLILAKAGLLDSHNACSHWAVLSELASLGANPVRKRYVQSGKYLTASGVSAGIDMAFYLAEKLVDKRHAKELRFGIEYFPNQLNILSTYTLPKSMMKKLEQKVSNVIEQARIRFI